MNWYLSHEGQEIGPYPFEQIRAMAASSQLQPNDYIRQETGDWLVAGRVPGLFMSQQPMAVAVPQAALATTVLGSTRSGPKCSSCGGYLRKERIYRLSGPAVFIGWIFLVPSILGIAFGVLVILLSVGKSVSPQSTVTLHPDTVQSLLSSNIPASTIAALKRGDAPSASELRELNDQQRDFVAQVRSAMVKQGVNEPSRASYLAFGMVAGSWIIVGSIVAGLWGWILTMKKNVLRCLSCTATVAAS